MTSVGSNFNVLCGRPRGADPPPCGCHTCKWTAPNAAEMSDSEMVVAYELLTLDGWLILSVQTSTKLNAAFNFVILSVEAYLGDIHWIFCSSRLVEDMDYSAYNYTLYSFQTNTVLQLLLCTAKRSHRNWLHLN